MRERPGLQSSLKGAISVDVQGLTVAGMPGRYASALFELAGEAGARADVDKDLGRFEALLDASDDLVSLVRSPVYSTKEQVRAVAAVLDKAGIAGLARSFICLVASNRRLFAVADMIRGYRALLAHARGEVGAEVVSATKLTQEQLGALVQSLKEAVGSDVRVDTKVDANLLGGLIVKVGSQMVDSSLKTKLDTLRIAMKEVG